MRILALALAVGCHLATLQPEGTLGAVLKAHRIAASDLPDAERMITSYAVAASEDWFGIAYYWAQRGGELPSELRIRTLEKARNLWRETTIEASQRAGGSAMGIARGAGAVYVHLHVTPSASELLALTEDLKLRRRLVGWPLLVLPDGRVIYHNNMVHFAPAHPGSISLYDPRADRAVRIYPERLDEMRNGRWINRTITSVSQVDDGTVQVEATEQDVLITSDDRSHPDGPLRAVVLTCTLAPEVVCRPRER